MGLRTKIAIIGDPHLAVPRGEADALLEIDPGRKLHGLSQALLEATIQQVNAEGNFDAVLILGDLTRDSEDFNHELALKLLGLIDAPVYIVLGNHDLVRQRPPEAVYSGCRRLDRDAVCDLYRGSGLPGGKSKFSIELPGGVDLVVCDGNLTLDEMREQGADAALQDGGRLGEEQRAWLAQMLDDSRKAGRLPLVSIHHTVTPHSPAERRGHLLEGTFRFWQLSDAEETRQVLAAYGVPLVLSGHIHAQSATRLDGVLNLCTSASVSYPHAWRSLEVHDGAIFTECRRIESVAGIDDLQSYSREAMGEGMAELVRRKAASVPALAGYAEPLGRMVQASGWWARFSAGTQQGYVVPREAIPEAGLVGNLVISQAVAMLNEYGAWKAGQPDPWKLELPLES